MINQSTQFNLLLILKDLKRLFISFICVIPRLGDCVAIIAEEGDERRLFIC